MGSRRRKQQSSSLESQACEDGDSLSPNHQVLLQYLIHGRMLKSINVSSMHNRLFNDSQSLSDTISEITKKINPLKMDIKTVRCEVFGDIYYTVIHTTGESFYPRCCLFSKNQLGYLKQLLTGIAFSNEGKMGRIQALNISQSLSKSEAEDTLDQFLVQNILIESEKGELFFSPLTIAEFEPFFRSSLEDSLLSCDLCLQMVFHGKVCEGCKNKFHHHCVTKYMSSNLTDCPTCHLTWQSK